MLRIEDVPKPVPGDNEILVRVHAASVIAGDCEFRRFDFPAWFWLPLRVYAGILRPKRVKILGQELSGVVEEAGGRAARFEKGDAIFAATEVSMGAYAEYICLDADKAIAFKHDDVSFERAAVIPTGGLNALHYLRLAKVVAGEKILINGACGNIGSYAVQLAKHYGAIVTAVDSADKLETLRTLGADRVIDFRQQDFTRSAESYDVILDVVGKAPFSRSVSSLNSGGRFVIANPRISTMLRGVLVTRTTDKKVLFRFAAYESEDLKFLGSLVHNGKLTPLIDRQYPLEQIVQAHRYVDSGRIQGNVAIRVADQSE
ncbi:MAG: NAD(P)-dependent alcohol dehydrogenase [Gammaproteobacteria bacterium]|nr:NAD(P)-dependent alcohol dehydrogenase [Gammaproteobacteria bacterium]